MENFVLIELLVATTYFGVFTVIGYSVGCMLKKGFQKSKEVYLKKIHLHKNTLVLKGLFLDDVRFPEPTTINQNLHSDLYDRINEWAKKTAHEQGKTNFFINWTIVRNVNDFSRELKKGGYDIFSFDHDLQDFSDGGKEKTGYDAVKLLVEWWETKGVISGKALAFHTQNHIGKNNMIGYINSYLRVVGSNIVMIA